MDVTPIITRLRTPLAAAGFVLVAGAGDLDAAIEGAPGTPSAYVLPLAETPEAPDLVGVQHQRLAVEFAVVVVVSNVRDATGAAAAAELATRRIAVRQALAGWIPDAATGEAVVFIGGRLLKFHEARLWWTDEFRLMRDYWS